VLIRCTVRRRSESTVAAPEVTFELQQGNVLGDAAGAVPATWPTTALPSLYSQARSGIMPADRLAPQRAWRSARETPRRVPVGAGLAFVDLRAFGMQRENSGFTRCCDGLGNAVWAVAFTNEAARKRQ
jgi:hypothetical protein